MAEYKAKKELLNGATYFGVGRDEFRVIWSSATQEELAYIYEEIDGGSNCVDKIEKSNKSNEENNTKGSNSKDKSINKQPSEEK